MKALPTSVAVAIATQLKRQQEDPELIIEELENLDGDGGMGEGEIKVEAIKEEQDTPVGMYVGSGGVPNRNTRRQYQGGYKGKGGGQRYVGGGWDNATNGCTKCGNRRGHEPNYPCPAATKQCNTCGKTGHYSKVCWNNENNQTTPIWNGHGTQTKTASYAQPQQPEDNTGILIPQQKVNVSRIWSIQYFDVEAIGILKLCVSQYGTGIPLTIHIKAYLAEDPNVFPLLKGTETCIKKRTEDS
eukprot:GHVR01037179.1.p1 GENE.GHVR01037179.1~~GHVR01037179.1.p1  ORF type:complete len:243 (-),score=31.14 GHVR01037179.1:1867-2595(-)